MRIFFAAGLLALAVSAHATGMSELESFLKTTKSGRAEFRQVVTSPVREGVAARTKVSAGSFEFLRPGRFKFTYKRPFEQLIVADGHMLWTYDPALQQATARKQATALGSSPAALMTAYVDMQALQTDYSFLEAPEKDGLQWVQALPKSKDGALQTVRIGMRQGLLAALEFADTFGQVSVLTFTDMQINPSLAPADFQFKPPAGVDVLQQ
ncbi:MAG: outer membrane lipoprotein chaperone LolA [Rhodoferax sp.]|nr:outer membrane lipoprotein chaperone LolA [Rhodoferax sp.]